MFNIAVHPVMHSDMFVAAGYCGALEVLGQWHLLCALLLQRVE